MGDTLSELQSVAVDVLRKQCSEFNWYAVSSVERKGRLGLRCETTDKSVNVAAICHLERQTLGSGIHMGLPKLDEVVGVLAEKAEDAAPLGPTIIPENMVNSETATNVERTT